MGKISGWLDGPEAPDYKGAAEATAAANAAAMDKQTWQNRINQYGPAGSKTYEVGSTIDPTTGKPMQTWSEYTKLTPEQQAMWDQNEAIQSQRLNVGETAANRLSSEYGTAMDWSKLSPYGTTPTATNTQVSGPVGDPNDFRQRGEDASYESQMRRITPQYEDQVAAMEVKLRNQGLNPDDRAWQNQMQAMSEAYNDASQSARLTAAGEGRQESSLNWGQAMEQNKNKFGQSLAANEQNFSQQAQAAAQANALRQQQFIEQMQQRGFSLNEINAMTSGQQVNVPQFGGYNQAGYTPGADYSSAALNQGNFDQGSYQALWGGIGSLGGAAASGYGSYKSNTQGD